MQCGCFTNRREIDFSRSIYHRHYSTVAVVRLSSVGLPDSTFGINGQVLIPFSNVNVEAVVQILIDGSILIAGKSNNLPLLLKLNPIGGLSNNFGTGGILSFDNGLSGIIDLIVLEDGKILGCGKKSDQFCVLNVRRMV
ncbi:MAG: hypothetical protein IPG95_00745 [Saprospiraceae bacterium]|nr:hypothetical protein [Saprospiraceae bacterium]